MKYYIVASIIILTLIGLYLNRAYAHIFSMIHAANLSAPPGTDHTIYPATAPVATTTLTYVALGDSLTAGVGAGSASATFPFALATALANNDDTAVHLINLGIPGTTVAGVLDNELPVALSAKPSLVTILIGTNDVFEQTPLATFQNNLTVLLQRLSNVKKIILLTIPDLGTTKLMLPPYRAYFSGQTNNYNNAVRGTGSGFANVTIVDLNALQKQFPFAGNTFYAADGLHPSAAGYNYWSALIYAHSG